MRRLKASLKKYFYFTFICALLLIFGFNIKGSEVWKTTKATSLKILTFPIGKTKEQQEQFVFGNSQNDYEYSDDYENGDDTSNSNMEDERKIPKQLIVTTVISQTSPTEMVSADSIQLQSQIEQEQQKFFASNSIEMVNNRSWFFKNGVIYPKPQIYSRKGKHTSKKSRLHGLKLFPHQDRHSDRIVNQLMYVPSNYDEIKASGKLKRILLFNGVGPWTIKQGREVFLRSKCPVDTCELTAERKEASTADMILYKDFYYWPSISRHTKNIKQVTMLYYLECPYHTHYVKIPDAINWTATYRRDSDIVAPYEKWVYYDDRIRQMEQEFNYAENKTKKVAWFVSNCGARNGRLQYAHELAKYINVDIYGNCGNLHCSRSTANKCFELLDRDYKFYLAFENSNCRDYVTEKFFVNALSRNILPIVMGARPEDYEIGAPHRSYIHVDEFTSAKELADYLHILDKDDKLYNSYFKWKGTGEFINTYFWCRVCAALHDEESLNKPRWYADVNNWWSGPGVCTIGSWRNYKARHDVITDD